MAFFDDLEPQDLSFAFQRPKKAEEGPGIVRGAADSALALGQGAVSGVKMLSDATGAGNDLSNFLGAANKYLESLESNERQAEKRQIAELIKQAEASGSPSAEIAAYLTHFTKAPLDTILNAIGSAAPTIGAAALAAGAGPVVGGAAALGMGAVQGAGVVKGTIYDRVKDELTQQGLPPEEVEARAQEAQAYAGPNAGLIGTGAGLGAVAGRFGAEGSLLARTAGTSSPNIVRRAAGAGVTEAIPEGLQGGQEQYASNVAAQREGVDTPTWRGVLGSGALEAVAGGGVGATFGAMTPPRAAPAEPPGPLTRAAEIAAGVEAGMAAANQVPLLSGPGAQPASWEVVDDRPMLPGSSPAALAIGYTPEQTDGTIMVDPQGNAARMTPEFEREKGAERAAAQERAVETGLTPDVVEAQRRREAPVQVAPESIEDIVGAYRDEFETTPAGMTIEQMRSFAARRRAAEAEQIGKIAALAEREGVRVPARRGDSSMMMTPEPDDSGKWRITRFTKDGEPESHSVYNTAAEAAREILNNARVTRPGSGFRIEPAGDKAIVLLGDEKRALAGRIEQLGGKWNSARNGWTFPKTREPQVRQALADLLGGGNAQQPKSDTAVAPQGVRGQGGVAPGDGEAGAGVRVVAGRDGDVAGAGRPDAGGRPTEPVRDGQPERNAALKPRTREQAAAQRRAQQEARDPFVAFLGRFGVSMRHQKDITGEAGRAGNRMLPYYGPMFRKNGLPLDILAQYAVERGFLTQADIDSDTDTGGTRKLAEMIRRAHAREVVGTPMDEEARRNQRMQEESEAQLYGYAASLGIDTEGMSPEDVTAYLEENEEAIIADKANRMVQAAIDEEGYDSADAVILGDVTIDEAARIALATQVNEGAVERAAIAAGEDDIEFLTRIEEIIREAPDAERVAGRGQEVQATARSEAGDAEEAQAGRGRDAPVQEEGEAFGLTAPTPDEIRRQTQEQERAQQEARQREQAPPAEEFTLTGSTRPADEAAARGQMELGSAPPVDAAAKAEPAETPKAGSAEQAIRDAFKALPSVTVGSWYPITVTHNGRTQHFLANQKALSAGRTPAAIHLVNVKHGRMIAGADLEPIATYYRLTGKNELVEEGVPGPARDVQLRMWERAGFPAPWAAKRETPPAPVFATYADANDWINEQSKIAGGKGKFTATDEYKEAYAQIKALYDAERAASSEAAMKQLADAGMKIGDRVQYTVPGFMLTQGTTHRGTLIERGGFPVVKLDGEMDVASKGRISTVKSIRWDGRWEKDAEAGQQDPKEAARYLKDFVYSLSNLDGMTDRAAIILGTGPLAKSGRDRLLMDAFGLTRDQAHEINNRLDSRQPKSLRNEDMQEAFTIFPGLRKVVDDALAEAKPRETRQRITPDAAGNMKPGDIIVDAEGREYRAHRARGEFLDAHPIVDGKANVSAETTARFHLNPETAEAHPDRRADAVFATGRNLNEQDSSGLTDADRYAKKRDAAAAELAGQFIEETKDGDYDGLMATVERWAKDAEVAADDLRAATLKALDKMDAPAKQKNAIRLSLNPARMAAKAEKQPEGKIADFGEKPARNAVSVARDIAKARPFADVTELRRSARDAIVEQLGAKALDDLGQGSMMTADELTQAIHDGQYEGIAEIGEKMPVPITEDQIGIGLATQAFAGTSHSPERRGQSAVREYVRQMVGAWRRAEAAAGSDPDALARVTEQMRALRDGYSSRYRAYLSSHANVASSMIAGPEKFPVERNRKRSAAADKRAEEANDFLRKGVTRMLKAAKAPVDSSPDSVVAQIKARIAEREQTQERMKAANVALRKGDDAALRNLGFDDAEIERLKKPDFAGRTGYPSYTLTNNNSEIRRLKVSLIEAEKRAEAAPAGPTEQTVGGTRIEEDAQANRIRLYFDGKPDDATRSALKAAGFKWAPSVGAWQRQLTDNARRAAHQILGGGLTANETTEQYRVYGPQAITAQEGGYQTDLFGDPLPSPRGNARPARPDGAGVPGDVRPAAAVQDTAAPQGDYLVKTIVGSEARRTLGASSIKTAADAARATKYLYRHAVERFDGIVTDADGKPLAVVGGFKGALTQAAVYPATLMGEAVRIPGAARIWFSHNHPSGSAELSAADVLLNGALTKVFKGSGIEPMGLLAIAGDRYAFVDPRQDSDSNLAIPNPQERVEVPVIERMLVPPGAPSITIDRPDAAKRIGKVYYDRMKQPGMLLLTAQNVVAAWVPLSPAMTGTLRGTGGMNALYRAASEANAAGVILVHGGELDSLPSVYGTPAIENIGAALRALDVTPLDAINVVSGESRAEKGGSLASGPVFARGAGRGLPTAEVSRISDAVRKAWANAPEVVVVPDMADPKIPAEVRDADAEMRASGAEGEPEGFFYGGKVYLVAGALDRPADVVRVMAHESLGHYGLRGVFGDRLASILGQIANARPREVAAKMREYGLTGVEGQLQAAEEVLAVMAQTNPKLGFVKRAIAAIRTWLRERGFDVRMSNDEIVRNFILPARAWVQRGGKAGTGAPAFSRRAVTQTPAFKAWFGESKVVDAEGRPLVVYHGTAASISAFAQWEPNFFTADPSYAEGYAGKRGESGGNIVPVFLSIQNPMDGTTAQGRALYDRYREFAADEYGREVPPLEDGQHVPFTEADRVFVFLRRIARTENSQVDGILVDEGGTQGVSWVPLRPEQIKSATGNRGTFDPANPDIRFSRSADVSPLGFYSELARRIESGPGRADAANWKSFIKSQKGIKPDEIEWTGINEFLDLQPGKITKEAVREFLAANGVRVEETVLGNDVSPPGAEPELTSDQIEIMEDDSDFWTADAPTGNRLVPRKHYPTEEAARDFALRYFNGQIKERNRERVAAAGVTPKFASYTIPGGTNYREILLTLPAKRSDPVADLDALGYTATLDTKGAIYTVRRKDNGALFFNPEDVEEGGRSFNDLPADARTIALGRVREDAGLFRSSHWNQPNVLAHVRFDERVDADGKRVLFINELQSDWAQKGRKKGFKTSDRLIDGHDYDWWSTEADRLMSAKPFDREAAMRAAENRNALAGKPDEVPRAPFVEKTEAWVALALKRMIRYGAENGFGRVAIVSGEQAADLFDLSKQVQGIAWTGRGNDTEKRVTITPNRGNDIEFIVQPDGAIGAMGGGSIGNEFDGKRLDEVVGKDVAERIMADPYGDMRGNGLKIGGEGMKGFYDRIVPTVAKDVLKKLGGGSLTTVEVVHRTEGGFRGIPGITPMQEFPARESRMTQLGFDITPELRKRAMDGMPMFSRRPTRKQISDHIADALKSSKGFNWWHKTLGTQYEKAQVNPYFRRVFDGAQNFLNDVSDFANRAADLAPSILPKMNGIADVLKKPIPKKDLDAIARPIFEGTLENADPAKGKVWTDAELRSRFSLNDRQIGLYREFRAAVDKSLDDMGKTDLLRYAGKDGNPVREQVLEARTIRSAGQILAAHLNSIGQEETATTVIEKAARIEGLKAGGYAPLMRFGRFSVYVTRPDPEGGEPDQVYFGMFETQRDANRMARKFREDPSFADADVTQGTMSQEAFKLFQGVNPDTLELFADVAGIEQTELFQTYLKLAKSNRSAMKRLINRKGVAGFSEDVSRVLASFITSNAKAAASNLNIGEMNEAASSVPKEQGDVKDEAVRLVEFVRGTNDPSSKLRSLLFMQYLGGSVASALVNMTQPLTMTYPYLAQFLGAGKAGTVLGKAMKDAVTGVGSDKDLADALKQAESDGIVSPQEIHHLYSEAGIGLGRNTAIRRATFAWGSLFSAAEQFNRRSTFIAAYRTAREQGIANPFAFAEKAVVETQGIYARSNRPNWARNPVGATLLTFKQFSIAYLEFLKRLPPKERALALAVLVVAAGLEGLPGADDLDDLIDTAAQAMGYNWQTARKKREWLTAVLGQGGAEFALRGMSAVPGIPIDVSARLSVGNLVPGTGLLLGSTRDKSREITEVLGAGGSFAQNVLDAGALALDGEMGRAAKTVAPLAVQNALKGLDMYQTGIYRDTKGRRVMDVDAYDAMVKAIGFQPAAVAANQRKAGMVFETVALVRNVESRIAEKWARGVFEKDAEAVKESREELREWNRTNPEARIAINSAQIAKRVQAMRATRADRLAKTAPRELRQAVKEAL